MISPSVFLLGAQKCGTTTVADLLSEQSEIFVPSIKETYFFCDESRFARGEEWYHREFYSPKAIGKSTILCDATPFYLTSCEALGRISGFTGPNAKFIVCLRDPVKRAYSAYWHQRRLGNEKLGFTEALQAEEERIRTTRAASGRWWRHAYRTVGQYGQQMDIAFECLGRTHFLILFESDLKEISTLQYRVRKFLDLPERSELASVTRSNNSSMPYSSLVQNLVNRRNPLKHLAQAMLPRQFRTALGIKLLSLNSRSFDYPPMNPMIRAKLREQYEGDFTRLESLGITVPHSWYENAK
ncbi:sulfotransferase family protein [Rhodopirellula sp. P2]|uniref:sulfotransferase family protein n=1 Tax=Rhodopirellula sp. P2 TaxID=2127060 RepID=UPI0023686F85|nr:sulfotransferase [Rhodopirellula sp. P2]WDQ17483.1 sulfotransferase [Rhodopirellula sp. P2]